MILLFAEANQSDAVAKVDITPTDPQPLSRFILISTSGSYKKAIRLTFSSYESSKNSADLANSILK